MSNQERIIKRLGELVAIECDAARIENKLNVSDYEKRLKCFEEELSNKEIHMNMLRKKVVDLEEGTLGQPYGKSELKAEFNNQLMTTKTQKVKIEHLTVQVQELKLENVKLKANMLDSTALASTVAKKDADIKNLLKKLDETSLQSDKQLVQINELKEQIDSVNLELSKTIGSSDEAISSLSKELRVLKQNLAKSESREKEVGFYLTIFVEFREFVY